MSKLEKKLQHREFVQNVITRMNTNSFQIKGLAITIVSAFLAVFASEGNKLFIFLPIPITLLFWFLDAYYLQQERKFRGIYNDISGLTESPKTKKIYQMNPNLYCGGNYDFIESFISKTVWPLYLVIITGLLISFFITVKYL
jgi:hypothetical protein